MPRVSSTPPGRGADVRADPGQDVVAGEQHVVPLVGEAQMTGRVAGGPERAQRRVLAQRPVAVLDEHVGAAGRGLASVKSRGGIRSSSSLRGTPRRTIQARSSSAQPSRRREVAEDRGVGRVHSDPGAGGLPDLVRETEVVGVKVRDQDRGDLGDLVTGGGHPGHQAVPGLVTGPAGIDKHRAALGLDQVGEDVPQRAVRERRRHRPETRPDLLNRRQDAVAPSPLLHGPGDGDLLLRHRRTVFNGH